MLTVGKRSVPFYDIRLEVLGMVYFCPNIIQRLRKDHLIPSFKLYQSLIS